MSKYYEEKKTITDTDADGNVVHTKEETETKEIKKSDEPSYIKIYTDMWCSFNQIPEKWRPLFLSLACRMSFANREKTSEYGGQVVHPIGRTAEEIVRECGWKTMGPLYEGLKALADRGAIRKLGRGEYQINPSYAGRGSWLYNQRDHQGGIEDISTTFQFRSGKVDTKIKWK